MPWTNYTMQRFVAQKLPHGPILVPACGPGHELVMLANAFSDGRHIIGIDLAEGMVDLANSRCKEAAIRMNGKADQAADGKERDPCDREKGHCMTKCNWHGRAWAEVADACDLATRFPNAAGVFSLFGLQQLPQPHTALANWVKTLCLGGSLAVAFWPSQVEDKGPWQRLADLSTNKPRAGKAASSQYRR